MAEMRIMLCMGGVDGKAQADIVKNTGVHMVTATPGRLKARPARGPLCRHTAPVHIHILLLPTQFWWRGQMGMARGAVWTRSLS